MHSNPPSPYLCSGNSVSFVSIYPADCLTTRPGPQGSGPSRGQVNQPCVFSQGTPHSILGPDNSSWQPQGYSRGYLGPLRLQFPDWPGRAEFESKFSPPFSPGCESLSFSKTTLQAANSQALPWLLVSLFSALQLQALLPSEGLWSHCFDFRSQIAQPIISAVGKQGDLNSK